MKFKIVFFIISLLSCTGYSPPKMIRFLRKKIDFVDDRILDLLKIRFQICKELGYYKNTTHVIDRENEIITRLCDKYDDKVFIYDMWSVIFEKSKKIQENKNF